MGFDCRLLVYGMGFDFKRLEKYLTGAACSVIITGMDTRSFTGGRKDDA